MSSSVAHSSDATGAASAEPAGSWLDLGSRYIAGGVVSLNRKVEPTVNFVSASGSRLRDHLGREYIDYHAAFAPHLLGHNEPAINQAVQDAIAQRWSLMGSGTTPWEVRLAELLCESVPSLERVQITNTGSEATAHAIRLSRAWTDRDDIILILGGYNGWHNEVARAVMPTLDQVGPRVSPGEYRFLPLSAGIPESTTRRVHLVNFNDLESVEYVMRRHPTACVLTEPVLQNIGVVLPEPGYLEGLRGLCDRFGVVLVFDEVKTGFRTALGGYQGVAGIKPDLSVFGKAVANGFPMGVIGGRADLMARFHDPDPAKRVLIAGTYNAHPVSSAAAIATLERLRANDSAVYGHIETRAARLEAGLNAIYEEFDVPAVVARNASAFCTYFMDHAPVDWHDILNHHDFELDRRLRVALIERGVYAFPLACKQNSVSAAHSEDDIDQTLHATRDALDHLLKDWSRDAL